MLHDEEVDLLQGEAVLIRLPLLLDDRLVVHEDLEVQAEVGRHVELRARLRRVRLLKADQKEGEGRNLSHCRPSSSVGVEKTASRFFESIDFLEDSYQKKANEQRNVCENDALKMRGKRC